MAGFEIQPLVILLWSLLYFLYTLVFNLLYTLTIVFYRNGTLDLKPIKIKKKMDYIRSHIRFTGPAHRLVIRALILKITLTSLGHTEHMQLFIMDHGWLPNFDVTLYILNSDSM